MQVGSKGYVAIGNGHAMAGRPYFVKVLKVIGSVVVVEALGPKGKEALTKADMVVAVLPSENVLSSKQAARTALKQLKLDGLRAKVSDLENQIMELETELDTARESVDDLENDDDLI